MFAAINAQRTTIHGVKRYRNKIKKEETHQKKEIKKEK